MTNNEPHLIEFGRIGESAIGFISIAENKKIPFEIKRVYWAYFTPESVVRGRHAHHNTEQILIAASGRIEVSTETADGKTNTFILDHPDMGVFIPKHVWHTMKYSHYSTQVVLASTEYDESDYIRDYTAFKNLIING